MGISLSTTTTTTTSTARSRAPNHPYPPHLHPYPADYYTSYPVHPSPYTVHPSSSSSVYYPYRPYYNSNAYAVCNNATSTTVMGQPYFGSFEPGVVLGMPCSEEKPTKIVNSDVNVHKDTFRLERDDLNPERCVVTFVFDAMLDGSITIYYFAREEADRRVVPLFPETYVPIKVPFRKGLHQEFRQPSGTGIDLRFFAVDYLASSSSRDDVFPIVISATCPTPYTGYDRSYLLAHTNPQMQITQMVLIYSHEGHFIPKVVRQILWTDDASYELREIYGLGKFGPGFNDNASGKECVVCMTEPKDIALLPCRHLCLCSDCAKALRLQSNKCPICREIIEAVIAIRIEDLD